MQSSATLSRWRSLTASERQALLSRPAQANPATLREVVADIIQQVATAGDQALIDYAQKFDGAALTSLALQGSALRQARDGLSDELRQAIDLAYDNIRRFHQAQLPQDIALETSPGVQCAMHHTPLTAVGLYIPGGSAPLPSTVLMLGIPAQVAGCERKVLCSPPNADLTLHPAIVYAAHKCGIDEIYLVGGAQAIAAMALGTESIAKVDKIFGPGNSFVTEAKQQVSQMANGAAIDMPAGPSEVLVIADQAANPEFVAADLLSQAEHGADSQAVVVANCERVLRQTQQAVARQLAESSRQDITQRAMGHARYILTDSIAEAVQVSNAYAPEHLIVQTAEPRRWLPEIRYAGSIFLGQWSPESAGDYASGTNHVLPTYGYARNYSSLGLGDFYRRFTVQELSAEGLTGIAQAIVDLAAAEGLDAHKNAVAIRLQHLKSQAATGEPQ